MKRLHLSRKLVGILIKDRIHYPGRLAAETAVVAARCGVLLLLYRYVFALNNGTIQGIEFPAAAWSMFLYFAFSSLRLREIAFAMMRDVRSGSIETLLGKPVSYVPYRFCWQLGSGLYPTFVVTLVGGASLLYGVGLPDSMRASAFVPTLFVAVTVGILLSLLLYSLVGLLAFWIEDIGPIYWVVDKAVMILGGSYLPVALFPESLQKLAVYSPFGASQFLTHTVNAAWRLDWPRLLAIQFAWTGALALAVWLLFSRARRKVSINGG